MLSRDYEHINMLKFCKNENAFAFLTAHIIRQRSKKGRQQICVLLWVRAGM